MSPIKEKTKILIVDDHPIVRKGVSFVVNREPDLQICAEAENAEQALKALDQEDINLALVDISLGDISGIQLTEAIKSQYPQLPVVILTIHDEKVYAESALKAGAEGFVNKGETAETIIKAIRFVLSGKKYLKSQISQDVE